jgi:Tol biopolymer transport system component
VEPPALVELSADNQTIREIPIAVPTGCAVDNLFAQPRGVTMAIEFSCSFGQAVVWLNTDSGELKQPVTESDSHFMAWTPNGAGAYLKVDSMNRPHIIRAPIGGKPENVPITELTYDLSPRPHSNTDFLFSFSRGLGLGSEMWLAGLDGRVVKQVIADPHNYLSFADWSPDGRRIAFIRIPDSAVPFTVGELWVMQADGSNARKLADVDAGHGFAEAWSPDASQIAFVVRDNPQDVQADQNADALRSNISIVNVNNGSHAALTSFPSARVEAPVWSPDGNRLAFTVVLNDRMNIYLADMASGKTRQALSVSSCCAVWMRK